MLMSDREIELAAMLRELTITPFHPAMLQPASVDVRLAGRFAIFPVGAGQVLDPADLPEDLMRQVELSGDDNLLMEPGTFVLGSTVEKVRLGGAVAARLEGKSSLGRIGLIVHSTAGFIDPGFVGTVTLELSNISGRTIRLRPGMKIGQIAFMRLGQPARRLYGDPALGSKYAGQDGPTPARSEPLPDRP